MKNTVFIFVIFFQVTLVGHAIYNKLFLNMKIIIFTFTIFLHINLISQIKYDDSSKKKEMNINLVELISSIHEDDQKYRGQDYKKNIAKQIKLDSLNLSIIDSLYKIHKTYIGKSLVGDKLSHIMWLIIQHSNINKMEEYLPIIGNAVENKELSPMTLAMLLDRIYTINNQYQIFGSQRGVKLGDEKIRKKVKVKYGLDGIGK